MIEVNPGTYKIHIIVNTTDPDLSLGICTEDY